LRGLFGETGETVGNAVWKYKLFIQLGSIDQVAMEEAGDNVV
jgi:hypothetical protein